MILVGDLYGVIMSEWCLFSKCVACGYVFEK